MATVSSCIKPVIDKMTIGERAMLHVFLECGADAKEELKKTKPSPFIRRWGKKRSAKTIAAEMNTAFQEGFGIWDRVCQRADNYGEQLDYIIRKVFVKFNKEKLPDFEHDADSKKGAIEREQWIVEQYLNRWWKRLSKKARVEIITQLEQELTKSGIDPQKATHVGVVILSGGLTAARKVLGFKFFILLAKLAKLISRSIIVNIIGKGIPFGVMAVLMKIAGRVFSPPQFLIIVATLIPTISAFLFPREYDKFIPVVLLIGLKRLTFVKKAKRYPIAVVVGPNRCRPKKAMPDVVSSKASCF